MSLDLSLGAVGAALIAAIVSLIGLVISKEQKVSDFRQAWIDSLRSEIVTYLTSFNAISDALAVTYKDHTEKVKTLAPLYSSINMSHFSIILRLNPDEEKSKAVLLCLGRFFELAQDESKMISSNIKPVEVEFLQSSNDLLKYEWRRVKRGETTFIAAKIAAVLIVALLFCYGYYAIFWQDNRVEGSGLPSFFSDHHFSWLGFTLRLLMNGGGFVS